MMSSILAQWSHSAPHPDQALVLPDGCRDVVVVRHADGRAGWFLTDLQSGPLTVSLAAGVALQGYRLAPGARVDTDKFGDAWSADLSAGEVEGLIDVVTTRDVYLEDSLAALAAGAALPCDASVQRRWQRLFKAQTGQSPVFWRNLARARRAARALQAGAPAIAVAADTGYSDQAHLSREMRRWFGLSPTATAQSNAIAHFLLEPAYA